MIDIAFSFPSWIVPTIITLVLNGLALFWPTKTGSYIDGLDNILFLIPALFFSMVAWMVWGFLW